MPGSRKATGRSRSAKGRDGGLGLVGRERFITVMYPQLPFPLLPASPSRVSCSLPPPHRSLPFSLGTGMCPASPRRSLSPVAVSLGGAGRPVTGSREGAERGWRGDLAPPGLAGGPLAARPGPEQARGPSQAPARSWEPLLGTVNLVGEFFPGASPPRLSKGKGGSLAGQPPPCPPLSQAAGGAAPKPFSTAGEEPWGAML